jgi:hypothetical protein
MCLSYIYSLCFGLEHSHFDMILMVNNSYILVMLYLTSHNHVDIAMAYELAYSPQVMFILYMIQCFHVHTIVMNRNRFTLRWWFIMLSGMPKFFTYRSVGSGTTGHLGGHYVCGCWNLLTRTEKIRKRTDTVVTFTWRVLNTVSIGKRVSQLRVLT